MADTARDLEWERKNNTSDALKKVYEMFGYTQDGGLTTGLLDLPAEYTGYKYYTPKEKKSRFSKINKNAFKNGMPKIEGRGPSFSENLYADFFYDGKQPGLKTAAYQKWIDDYNSAASNNRAFENQNKWNTELDNIYDSVLQYHKAGLDTQRKDTADITQANLLRQGMFGSHLDGQYDNRIDRAYGEGLQQVDGVAQAAKGQAKTSLNTLMNNAVANIHAGNFEAANQNALGADIRSSIDSVANQGTSKSIDDFFSSVTRAYEQRQANKGTQLANQSYFSSAGNNGSVTKY